jgi:omega-6 fatty acid desaturase (delta-12 desaturase)
VREAKELLLATKPFAKEHRWRSWWYLWSTLVLYFAIAAISCLPIAWPIRLAASVLAGLLIVRLFIIYHDYQHGTILTKSRLARTVLNLFGMFVLSPTSIWNRSHNHHHSNNSKISSINVGSFPIMTLDAYAKASWRERFAYAFSRHPATIFLGYITIFFYGISLRSFIINPREHADAGFAVAFHLALVIALAIWSPLTLLFLVIIPMLLACGLGSYLFYAQHIFPGVKLLTKENWSYVSAATESSSFMKMSPIMHWFTGNIGYHHVHHLNAKIPFYRLREAMDSIAELQAPRTTSLAPWDIWRCLSLKVWDDRSQQYISFAAARSAIQHARS